MAEEVGHGLQIVNVTESHAYELNEDKLREILLDEDVKDLPVVVVSVAGAYRGGKSFLLNFFIRYLTAEPEARVDGSWLGEDSAPLVGFEWRSGIKAMTMGVVMWSKPFFTSLPSGEKVAILLVDTQGTFDSHSTVRDNSTIFALSTLVSSVQIYNISINIQEDHLQHLELFTEYGKLVNAESNAKAFQVLEVLVRDWQYPEDYPYGTVGGEQLLQEKLEITENLPKELQELRQHISSSFEKVTCFLMPHPGFKVLRPTFKGHIKDIDPDFRAQLVALVNSIFSPEKLLPKRIHGHRIKARDLFNYFMAYMELFNSDKIPNPTNILGATVKAGLLSAVSEAHDVYEKGMNAECGPSELSVPAVDLKFLHEKYVQLARSTYTTKKKLGSETEIAEYLEKLTKELNERLPQFIQSNLSKILTAINNAKDAYDKAINTITRDQRLCIHPNDLEQVHKSGVDAAMKTYDAARKRVTQLQEDERSTFLQELQKRYELQQRINNQNNNLVVSELVMKYWQIMREKTTIEPPVSSSKFKEEHHAAQTKVLEDFDSKRNMPSHYATDDYKEKLTKETEAKLIDLESVNKSQNKNLIFSAIEEYDRYMNTFFDQSTKCLHPDVLEEEHRLGGMCRALAVFRPQKQCSSGFDSDDEDEANLSKVRYGAAVPSAMILMERYEALKRNNDNENDIAVEKAFNAYVEWHSSSVKIKFLNTLRYVAIAEVKIINWVSGSNYIASLRPETREDLIKEGATVALQKFYEQRRGGEYNGSISSDPYRTRLITVSPEPRLDYYTDKIVYTCKD